MNDNKNTHKDRMLKKIRFTFSLIFSFFIYLPFYAGAVFTIFAEPLNTLLLSLLYLFSFILLIIVLFMSAYFFLYRPKWLKKFIFGETPLSKIFLVSLSSTSLLGGLLWIVPGTAAYLSGVPLWPFFAIIGAILGFIFGLISSVAIAILRYRLKDKL